MCSSAASYLIMFASANTKMQREEIESRTDKALLQVDFSENYTCQHQDEIQSAHWQQHQVSLFTAALWHSGKLNSIVFASDNLVHSKDTVTAYIDRLLEMIPDSVDTVSIWSDGLASQFKNRFIAAAMISLQEKHKIKIQWNFFATSHGKGPVDGIGGSAKRHVWMAVKQRKIAVVNGASSFAVAAKYMPRVSVLEMPTSEIDERNGALQLNDVYSDAPAIKGIAGFHHFAIEDGRVITFTLTNDAVRTSQETDDDPSVEEPGLDETSADEATEPPVEELEVKVGDWWKVEYDGEDFPGEVEQIVNGNYKVNVMHRAGSTWTWPKQKDDIFYVREV